MNYSKRIEDLLKERGLSIYQLSKISGVAQSTISNLLYQNKSINLLTIERLCTAFDISLSEFFDENDKMCQTEEDELLRLYQSLSSDSREALLTFLKTLK